MTTTLSPADAPAAAAPTAPSRGLSWTQVRAALPGAARGLDPRKLWRSPVLLIVEAGAALTTVLAVVQPSVFGWLVTVWLWATAFFAALAEAIAEARGKAQAASLRATQQHTVAHLLTADADLDRPESWSPVEVPSGDLTVGSLVVVEAGQVIPGDGDVVAGIASVDESAITGESAPVIRESGGDRCAVTGGTVVLSDRIVVRITARPGDGFVDRMIALVEGSERRRTPNEIALGLLLRLADGGVPAGRRHAAGIRRVQRCSPGHRGARRAARVPHPHHNRRAAIRDRHRGHGPAGPAQRAGDLGPRRRGRW
ncbi:hypothetical protein GCM10025876_07180 [Demequina litorisediminis]|uniref:P-type ATPase A domain-containing protein n=1 Tax=Demequina litorisediminis TaxID=1849022 RepID=A0ABQ6ICQ8_9MICO|nr:hypothetical protein GCM10025876_07180 [Demequina litorisediminis]